MRFHRKRFYSVCLVRWRWSCLRGNKKISGTESVRMAPSEVLCDFTGSGSFACRICVVYCKFLVCACVRACVCVYVCACVLACMCV